MFKIIHYVILFMILPNPVEICTRYKIRLIFRKYNEEYKLSLFLVIS